ncbi:MAG TPA: phosphohistidine phosphatase SixA [Anaerolineae bacterium]
MKIYLVQHGEAESKDVNPNRPLTQRGREQTQLMAEMAAKLELGIQEIRHSGKTRTEETAVIFGRSLSLMGNVLAVSGLGPVDDVRPGAEELTRGSKPVMLVGHLPFMARLAALLVNDDPEKSPVEFRNSGIVCLAPENGSWQVQWQLIPG